MFGRQVIILTAVFVSGELRNIKVKSGSAEGVGEKAIAAARKIQFVPGEKDGNNASQVLILEYHITSRR